MENQGQPDATLLHTDVTSRSLLERARASDAEAWRRLVALYGPLVLSWCQRAGLTPEDAADVFQEVFAAVAAGLARFRHDRSGDTFRGWLRIIARNQIRLHFRREADRPQAVGGTTARIRIEELPDSQLDDPVPSTDQEERNGLFHRGVEMIRSQFEPKTWQAFWLVAVDGRSAAEAAGQLGMTPGAVRQAKYAVLHRLRNELDDLLD